MTRRKLKKILISMLITAGQILAEQILDKRFRRKRGKKKT